MEKIMNKKTVIIIALLILFSFSFTQFTLATSTPGQIYEENISIMYRNTTVYAPAVAQTDNGYVGIISTITVTIQNNGSGRVFVDTIPLTQIDMQGSARLAVKVASKIVEVDNIDANDFDFFFVVRTDAPIIGGPSAGAIMTVATVALLENWDLSGTTVMTGMINPDGSIGPIGGIPQKIDAADLVGATRFLIPKGQGTYTETVTETIIEHGHSRTYSHPVTKSIADYAMENYGIEVIEVEDIKEAITNFTGYVFPTVESDKKISTEDYIDSMMPLAATLLNESKNLYEKANDAFDNSSIPNKWPDYYRNDITDFLNDGKDRYEESQKWYDEGVYYSSTSKSFQSLIDLRFVIYACEYFGSEDKDEYLTSLLNQATSLHENKSKEAKNAEINGMITLQCVGAAQKRVSEAAAYLSDASLSYKNSKYLMTLYRISFATERSNSVGWWLRISDGFNDTGDINITTLKNLVSEYMEDTQQSITYSTVILQEVGKYSSYITSAEELLESAGDNLKNDYPAAALFETLEALVKANIAIENIDGDAEGKIDRARNSSSSSIAKSRNIGIEPVLAVSYYEYAESLVNESSYDSALVYYKYGNIIAGAISFTNFSAGTASSRYIGIPEVNIPTWKKMFSSYSDITLFGSFAFIMGIIAGVGLAIIAYNIHQSKKPEEEKEGKWIPQSMDEYYKRQKKEDFPGDEIPRSIENYYKKNK
jgi:uncharacterized protein